MAANVPNITIHVKNLAGDVISIELSPSTPIAELKRRLPYPAARTVLFIGRPNHANGANPEQLENDRTIGSYRIGDGSEVFVLVKDREYPLVFGEKGREEGQLYDPCAVCVVGEELLVADEERISKFSLDGEFISIFCAVAKPRAICATATNVFVSAPDAIHVFSMEGARMNTIRGYNPFGMCIEGEELFVATPGAIAVFSLDGTFRRNMGKDRLVHPIDVCFFNNEMFVLGSIRNSYHQIAVFSGAAFDRTFGRLPCAPRCAPRGIRVSERGVFVSHGEQITVFDIHGTVQYSITTNEKFTLHGPAGMYLDTNILYIADKFARKVVVIDLPLKGGRRLRKSRKTRTHKKRKQRTHKRR